MHSRISVGLAAPAMDLADLLGEESILLPPLRGRPVAPCVIAALLETPSILHNTATG